jgi:hypothetical protein
MTVRLLASYVSVLASVAIVLAWPGQSLGAIVVGKTTAGSSLERVHIGETQAAVRRALGAPSQVRQLEEAGIHNYTDYKYRKLNLTVVFHGTASGSSPVVPSLMIPFRVDEIVTTSPRLTADGLHVGSTLAQARARSVPYRVDSGNPRSYRALECAEEVPGLTPYCEKIVGPPFIAGEPPHHSRDTELLFEFSLSSLRLATIAMSEWLPNGQEGALEGAPGFV